MKQILFFFTLLWGLNAWAYTPSDSAKISILTCSPGKEIYKVYGHTAIRFHDNRRNIVFNYGLFSFDEPHFIWRYLQGKNYYLLGVESYDRFMYRYKKGGEQVSEQCLNLTHQEIISLFDALIENAQKENREYLYNVLYDNCATRAYRILEDHIPGSIDWQEQCELKSFRDLLHEHNAPMPFSQMGIDIVFGLPADRLATCREQMFLPVYLMNHLALAKKENGQPLIAKTQTLLKGKAIHNNKETILFHFTFGLLLVLSIVIKLFFKRFLRPFQIIIYSLVGLCSLIVCFIAFFSIHPTVWPNLNLIWINPLWLVLAIRIIIKKRFNFSWQKPVNAWSIIMGAYLFLGLLGIYYIHFGLFYIIPTLVVISFKQKAYR